MFSAIKDFVMGTAITPFVDGTNLARDLGWVGAIGGAILGLASGGAGLFGGLVIGGVGGVLVGGATGMSFGLITGGFRQVAEQGGAARPSAEQRKVQHQVQVQQHRAINHNRYQAEMDARYAHPKPHIDVATADDKPIVGHHTAALHDSRQALDNVPEIGSK